VTADPVAIAMSLDVVRDSRQVLTCSACSTLVHGARGEPLTHLRARAIAAGWTFAAIPSGRPDVTWWTGRAWCPRHDPIHDRHRPAAGAPA